jgi:hypothetical protein
MRDIKNDKWLDKVLIKEIPVKWDFFLISETSRERADCHWHCQGCTSSR